MEQRKIKEREHANNLKNMLRRADDAEAAADNKKFYSITRKSRRHIDNWVAQRIAPGKKFLDFCCGEGDVSVSLASLGADITGIDISDVSIKFANEKAQKSGQENKPLFLVMDGENMAFAANSFDYIVCTGVLHHLDLKKVYPELARVLKPGGQVICGEPLAYNPVFQLYRKMTPKLRTEWEANHILTKESIYAAKKNFGKIDIKFFYLAALLAVPFRHTPVFKPVLGFFEIVDAVLLKIPGIQWLAWQTIFVLSDPKE
ncbi:MAG: class I SAM-dependent methyltransferase [Candidatus Nealsonbacteria bacterium DGGOD1a]|nr:MAG: class I SAM-dependent methyltransferase [Candidatus Nealsonbacteria bacterium DGGOD1a]